MSIMIRRFDQLSAELLGVLADLETDIFEHPYPPEKIEREVNSKHGFTCLIAYHQDTPCGFKAGYEMTPRLYYSWIGGVHPKFRGQGIAQRLMDQQHSMIKELGYQAVRTHTENRFRAMLILNIKNGFDITGVFSNELSSEKLTIVLQKTLAGLENQTAQVN